MRYTVLILSILAISCSSVQTRGSRNSYDEDQNKIRRVSESSSQTERIKITDEDILIDSLGFEKSYIKSISQKQKNYLLDEYGYTQERIAEINQPKEESKDLKEEAKNIYYRNRYSETKVTNKSYELHGNEVKGGLPKFFDIAMVNYESGNIKKAKNILSFIKESILEDDPIWFESAYYLGECYLTQNEFNSSLDIFTEILSKKDIPDFVNERSLVRAGQINCVLGEEEKAFNYFLKLRKQYPNSQYLPVADCSKI